MTGTINPASIASVQEAICARRSVRCYTGQPLSAAHRAALEEKLREVNGSARLQNAGVRLQLIAAGTSGAGKLGTYGVIRGASQYLCAVAAAGEEAAVAVGFGLEQVILHATRLGLGTCWLGGTFRKSQFSNALAVGQGQEILAVSPVGYPSERQSLMARMVSSMAKSSQRKAWDELFFRGDFHTPLTRVEAGRFAMALEMVRLAPSAANLQPWRILKNGGGYHFYRIKPINSMANVRLQTMDLGIAMCHFALTAEELKLKGKLRQDEAQKNLSTDGMKYICTWG